MEIDDWDLPEIILESGAFKKKMLSELVRKYILIHPSLNKMSLMLHWAQFW